MLYAPAAEYKPRGRFLFVLFRLLEKPRFFARMPDKNRYG